MDKYSIKIFIILFTLLFVPACAFCAPTIYASTTSTATDGGSVSGPAPLKVHCWADTEASDGAGADPFLDYEYTWTTDASLGNWATTNKSRSRSYGPVAAFVFDTPGTYTISLRVLDSSGNTVAASGHGDSFTVTVNDPDTYFSGTATTCVNTSGDSDFTGCPSGAGNVSTDDISTLYTYADADERILFKRGSSWTFSGSPGWSNNAGIVQIGAYGTCSGEDSQGICTNDPQITVSSGLVDKDQKQNWTLYNLHLVCSSGGAIAGFDYDMANWLFYRLNVDNSDNTSLGWSHTNDATPMTIELMGVVDCDLDGGGSSVYQLYVGGEKTAIMGNIAGNNLGSGGSHVMRMWQAYQSVVSHNRLSGSGYPEGLPLQGRQALKLHGPGESGSPQYEHCTPANGNNCLSNTTSFLVVSNNQVGGSAPWPVSIGPQDSGQDERLSDMLFNENSYVGDDYGANQRTNLQFPFSLHVRYAVISNNTTNVQSSTYDHFHGIHITQNGIEPAPEGLRIYNNTLYRYSNATSFAYGIYLEDGANHIVRNNLLSAPNSTGTVAAIYDATTSTNSNNVEVDDPSFVDENNVTPLSRDLSISPPSASVIDQGYSNAVWSDFLSNRRTGLTYDIGAYEYGAPADGETGYQNPGSGLGGWVIH